MLSRPEQTRVFQEDEEAKRPAGTKEMGTFLGRDEIQCQNRPQSTIIST